MFRRCCGPKFSISPPDWLIGIIVAILLCFFIWFLILITRELFSGEKVEGLKLRRPHFGRM